MPKNKEGKPAIAFSKLLGIIVRVVIIIFFVVAGLRIMNIEVLTKIGTTIIAYMPNILAAIIVFIVAWFVADKVSKLILKANPEGETFAKAVKWIIYIIAAFMILSQLHIASNIVHILFIALVVGLAGAFAIAFGVGGRFWAAKKLEDLDKNLEEQKAKREQYKAMRAAAGEGPEKAEKKRGSFFSGFGKKSEAAASDTVNAAKTNAYAASETAADEASNVVNSASGAADAAAGGEQKAGSAVSETVGNGIDKAKDVSADSAKKAADAKADDPEDSPYYYKNK